MCLAAWLTVVTGIGVSAAIAERLRGLLVVFWVAAVALLAVQTIRRRALSRSPVPSPGVCIAVKDEEIEEIWRLVPNGTVGDIRP
jgi:hypothetical protein